jgi:hypothetical protein
MPQVQKVDPGSEVGLSLLRGGYRSKRVIRRTRLFECSSDECASADGESYIVVQYALNVSFAA